LYVVVTAGNSFSNPKEIDGLSDSELEELDVDGNGTVAVSTDCDSRLQS
jgi:hypothetical protein